MKNKAINQILIPMDFSETGLLAMEHGAFMARLFKANLYLLHVLELVPFSFSVMLIILWRIEVIPPFPF